MEPHPLEAPEILNKEPDETVDLQFDFTDSQQLASSETISSIESTTITPDEEHHELTFSALTGGPLIAGEQIVADDGDTAVAVEATTSASAKLAVVVGAAVALGSGDELTGQQSGAVVTLSETNSASTLIADAPAVLSSSVSGKLVSLTIHKGIRPIAGAPWREYVVRTLVVTSLGQKLAAIGRLRVPEAAAADNKR